VLIRRQGFLVLDNRLTADGRCPHCSAAIPGVWAAGIPRREDLRMYVPGRCG
jgi:hypothetical protein